MTPFSLPPWALWVALGILAAVVEVLSPLFGFIFVSVAVIPSAILAASGLSVWWQLAAFAVSLILMLAFVRPRIIARVAPAPGLPPKHLELVGQRGRVIEALDPVTGAGRVHVGPTDWAARSATPIAAGSDIVVLRQDGVVLEVAPA